MSSYNSSDTFQQTASTTSNGYNLFPSAYQSTNVGGARKRRSSKTMTKKMLKIQKKMKKTKGGDCGCKNNLMANQTIRGGWKKRSSKSNTKKNKK